MERCQTTANKLSLFISVQSVSHLVTKDPAFTVRSENNPPRRCRKEFSTISQSTLGNIRLVFYLGVTLQERTEPFERERLHGNAANCSLCPSLSGDVLQLPIPLRGALLLPGARSAAERGRRRHRAHVHPQGESENELYLHIWKKKNRAAAADLYISFSRHLQPHLVQRY